MEDKVYLSLLLLTTFLTINEGKSLIGPPTGIRSDVIVTSGFASQNQQTPAEDQNQPGWFRQQLIRFGEIMGLVGNKLGGYTTGITRALEKVCEVIKTIIPVVAAVCHVGQFEFCSAMNEAPQDIADAMAFDNLNLPD